MRTVKILGVEIADVNQVQILTGKLEGIVFTPNVDHLVRLNRSVSFYEAYQQSTLKLCDSRIVKLFSFFLKERIHHVNAGSDFFPNYCKIVASQKSNRKKIFILGGSNADSAKRAVDALQESSEYNFIAGYYSPPFGFEFDVNQINMIIDMINNSGANVLAVGVGSPKQELFIAEIKGSIPSVNLIFAIGATIDFISGNQKRAPRFMQKLALEWLFRFIQEPKRMFKRYFIVDICFFMLIFKQYFGFYDNPFENSSQIQVPRDSEQSFK
jgi:N-acetylglucosaminyldiphosphoundecaprenol N-acetyl-beta-D-mannosaminyltransferase